VFATGLVLPFHCARFFHPQGWHVKNPDHSGFGRDMSGAIQAPYFCFAVAPLPPNLLAE
jgi:hypothetical protein